MEFQLSNYSNAMLVVVVVVVGCLLFCNTYLSNVSVLLLVEFFYFACHLLHLWF